MSQKKWVFEKRAFGFWKMGTLFVFLKNGCPFFEFQIGHPSILRVPISKGAWSQSSKLRPNFLLVAYGKKIWKAIYNDKQQDI